MEVLLVCHTQCCMQAMTPSIQPSLLNTSQLEVALNSQTGHSLVTSAKSLSFFPAFASFLA